MSRKFNAGLDSQIVVVFARRLSNRSFRKAVRKLARFFNVDPSVNDVIAIASFYGYTFGTSDTMVFVVQDGSEYAEMAMLTPEILELSVRNDDDKNVVVVL